MSLLEVHDLWVEVEGKQKSFQILDSFETDPMSGKISFHSPLGKALLHHRIGDTITIRTPSGSVVYRIVDIR